MKNQIPVLDFEAASQRLREKNLAHTRGYLAMYSSWLGGITREASLMQVPIDDHIVHRGDGIFEAIKVESGHIYALHPHLDRLERSAQAIGMSLPMPRGEIIETILQTLRAAFADSRTDHAVDKDALIRLYISRGPGGFTTNPYECLGSQLYVVITAFKTLPDKIYEDGVQIKWSKIPVKEGYFANIKSCNYLPNVLMKKEAVDEKVDFTISLDEKGFLAESSTENCAVVSKSGVFMIPNFERTLKGVTITRVMKLAEPLVKKGVITEIRQAKISKDDVQNAREMMLFGTTMNSLAVINVEGQPVADGRPGPVFKTLLKLLREDLKQGSDILTAF